MPAFCCVFGCSNRQERERDKRYFRFPVIRKTLQSEIRNLSELRRKKWVLALNREDFTLDNETKIKNARICSDHFISGKPAELEDVDNPDWVPSVKMRGQRAVKMSPLKRKLDRYSRLQGRQPGELWSHEKSDLQSTNNEAEECELASHDLNSGEQANYVSEDHFRKELQKRNQEIFHLRNQLHLRSLDEDAFKNNDAKVLYYTGVSKFKLFQLILQIIKPYLNDFQSLSQFQQLLLTLMKLRMNCDFTDLGYRFGISRQTAARCYHKCLSVMYYRMKSLIKMPEKGVLQESMPLCFMEAFGRKVCIIVDCFEIFIEKPAKLKTAASCWSNYKHHYTIKYLIGIVPQGVIAFISEAWGGRTSDKHITENCGFLELLKPGDVVMADRGFLIQDSVNSLYCEVILPDFTKGKKQLSPHEVENTRKIANVRIHVERVIGTIKQKYSILHETIPIATVVNKIDGVPETDMIVTVCCALVNLCKSVVPQN